jgi:tetratricopeptide (TPR) repeat protein
MGLELKTISKHGIAEALAKATHYRYLNEPEEAESICHDILAAEPEDQMALRMLGLAITDQFTGQATDRYSEVESIFRRLSDPYKRHYYTGILYERRAKAQMRLGRPPQMLVALFKEAMGHFEEAEKLRPPANDDALLRWNRCARLLQTLPEVEGEPEVSFQDQDSPPVTEIRRNLRVAR